MFKKVIILIIFFLLVNISYWIDTNYYEYAKIAWTDIIEFNSQINNKTYKVYIDTWSMEDITWSDNKLHSCFPIVWTWYTEKLWEIYFQYEWKWSYICSDNKLRWVFKIWAWWWWYMEDLENNPEKWKIFVNKTADNNWDYYHSKDWNDNGTWQSWLDGIWYANWNNARITFNIKNAFSNVNVYIISHTNWKIANGYNTWNIYIKLVYKDWKSMKNFKVDNISFITWYNSDVYKNWKLIPWYKYVWNFETNNNWWIIWKVISYVWWSRNYWLKIKIWNNEIIKNWNMKFKYPFDFNLELTWDEIPWKKYIWYNNKVKITTTHIDTNIRNLHFNNFIGTLDIWNYENYFHIQTWAYIRQLNNYNNFKIIWDITKWFYSWDKLNLYYNLNWIYIYKIWWNTYRINNFNKYTNSQKIYKYWKVKNVISKKINKILIANGKNILRYDVKFLNKNNYPINNLNFDLTNFVDSNKSFDLNSKTNSYETWFFITWDNTYSNIDGTYKVWIISYKPINNAQLTGIVKNIQYTGDSYTVSSNQIVNFKNIYFQTPIWINFENKILKTNQKDNFKLNYTKDSTGISNPSYYFTWYIKWCADCIFSWNIWKKLQDNNFQQKKYYIYISWSTTPRSVIYTWYYSYSLNWNYWNKYIKNYFKKEYSPIIYVNKWTVKIVWLAQSNNKILWWINYISTSIQPYILKNNIKKYVINSTLWYKWENVDLDKSIDLSSINKKVNIYKCWNNQRITIHWNYEWDKKIISLWCEINIDRNIRSSSKGHLQIFSYKTNNNIDFNNIDWRKNKWNIYINNNVDTIQASLYTNGSIFTYINNIENGVLTWRNQAGFKKQLYIYWKIFSKNTIWGWSQDKNLKFTILWWKKINSNKNIFANEGYIVAQSYDINFWRTSLLNSDNKTYNTWDLSNIIYNKYDCTWNKNTDKYDICSSSIIIQEPNKK